MNAANKPPRAANLTWHTAGVSTDDLAALHGHPGITLWFCGLSGSGKSTLANAVAVALHARGISTFVLDGDNVRFGLNSDLGFSDADRLENNRRVGEVARLFTKAAIVNLAAFISPFAADRELVRSLQPDTFVEIYCHADLALCEARDPKGLYKKARAGEIAQFTGIDSPYEVPENPDLHLDTGRESIEACVARVLALLVARGVIPA
ncbi:MAG: adenylyl-sulfate kinase [Proteobacteria bacterium]|nr:adenylyl-sulfate kinase [Pseudomonadota bacterium]